MDNNFNQHIDTIYNLQKEHNLSTRSLEYRKKQIQKITTWIESNESRIKTAIKSDLKKPDVEIDITEIWVCAARDIVVEELWKFFAVQRHHRRLWWVHAHKLAGKYLEMFRAYKCIGNWKACLKTSDQACHNIISINIKARFCGASPTIY